MQTVVQVFKSFSKQQKPSTIACTSKGHDLKYV